MKEVCSNTPVSSQLSLSVTSPGHMIFNKNVPVVNTSSVTSSVNSSALRMQFVTVNQMTQPATTSIKQEIITSTSTVSRKEVVQNVTSSSLSGPIVTPSSNMSPMHIEIKKESLGDELASPQPRAVDAGDTPNSISGDSSSGSLLDPQG